MKNLIEIVMDDGTKLYIEAINNEAFNADNSLKIPVASGERVVKRTSEFLESSFVQIKNYANSIIKSIKNTDIQPDEFEVEFAVNFSADLGIIISSISTEANVTIRMKWNNDKEN